MLNKLTNNLSESKSKRFLLYYALLLTIYVAWTKAVAPPFILRVAYMAAAIIPILTYYPRYTPFVVVLFDTMVRYGFSYSYMPFEMYWYYLYTFAGILFLLIQNNGKTNGFHVPFIILIFLLFVLMVEVVSSGELGNNTKTILMSAAFLLFFSKKEDNASHDFGWVFVFVTMALSILFLTHGSDYAVDLTLKTGETHERSGWEDPNYWGGVVGMGVLVGLYNLIHPNKKTSLSAKILYIIMIAYTTITLVQNASRGSIVALGGASVFLIVRTRIRLIWKMLIVIGLGIFIYYLYSSSMMDFLVYRFANDDGTGSDRTIIWRDKLDAFYNGGIIHQLFGYGRGPGVTLVNGASFHNDFIAHLVEYGYLGGILFVFFFFLPLYRMRGNKLLVISIMIYLFIVCMLIEPLAAGRPVYYAFWVFAYIMSRLPDSEKNAR